MGKFLLTFLEWKLTIVLPIEQGGGLLLSRPLPKSTLLRAVVVVLQGEHTGSWKGGGNWLAQP
jgi:hypothetical protein